MLSHWLTIITAGRHGSLQTYLHTGQLEEQFIGDTAENVHASYLA